MASMFTVASRFRRLKFVGSYLSTIEAVGTGSWLSVVQVLLDVSIALLVAIIEFHGGIHRGYRTISSEFFFVKRYMQSDLKLNSGSCSHDHVRSVTEARRLCHHPLVARSLLRQRMTLGAWQTHPFNSGTKQPSLALSVPSTAPAPSVGDGFGIP